MFMASNIFIFPIGKRVRVATIDKGIICGVLNGIVNLGGIPSIWIITEDADGGTTETVCLLNNVCSITTEKATPVKKIIL